MYQFTVGKKRLYAGLKLISVLEGDKPRDVIANDDDDLRVFTVCKTELGGSAVLAGVDESMVGGYSLAALFAKHCAVNGIKEAIFSYTTEDHHSFVIATRKGVPIIDAEIDFYALDDVINDIRVNTLPSSIQFGRGGQSVSIEDLAALSSKKVGLLGWYKLPLKVKFGVFMAILVVSIAVYTIGKYKQAENARILATIAATEEASIIAPTPRQLLDSAMVSYFATNKLCSQKDMELAWKKAQEMPIMIGGFKTDRISIDCAKKKISANYASSGLSGVYSKFISDAKSMSVAGWNFSAATSLRDVQGWRSVDLSPVDIARGIPLSYDRIPAFSDWIIDRGSWFQVAIKSVGVAVIITPPVAAFPAIAEWRGGQMATGGIEVSGDIIYAGSIINRIPEMLFEKMEVSENMSKFNLKGKYYVRIP